MIEPGSIPPLPRRPRAVVFDMDGTLLDTEDIQRIAMRETACEFGRDFPDALFLTLIGVHRDANTKTLLDHFGGGFPIDDFNRGADARFEAMCRQGAPLRPGARETLSSLAERDVPMAVATSTGSAATRKRLARAGIAGFFGAVVAGDNVLRHKPDPEPFRLAAHYLGIACEDCVAIEDSPNGLRAAAAAGMMALLIPDLVPPSGDAERLAHAILPDLAAARALIEARL